MRAALYVRVSTKEGRQFRENQDLEIRRYCDRVGLRIVKEYFDEGTGSKGPSDRNELASLLSDAFRGLFDVVVVYALDRFTREGVLKAFEYIERLKASGVEFRSVTEQHFHTSGPSGELFLAVAAWMAKQERIQLQGRIRAGLDRARAAGVKLGRRPTLIDQHRVQELRREGLTVRKIAETLRVSRSKVERVLKGMLQ